MGIACMAAMRRTASPSTTNPWFTSPIGWEHVNLTGDYTWQAAGRVRKDAFRPLRPFAA
jgi:hypothetical protein